MYIYPMAVNISLFPFKQRLDELCNKTLDLLGYEWMSQSSAWKFPSTPQQGRLDKVTLVSNWQPPRFTLHLKVSFFLKVFKINLFFYLLLSNIINMQTLCFSLLPGENTTLIGSTERYSLHLVDNKCPFYKATKTLKLVMTSILCGFYAPKGKR